MAKDNHFSSEDIHLANKQEKRYSTASLVNRATKSKATMRYPYISIRKMKIKIVIIQMLTKIWRNCITDTLQGDV